MLGMQQVQSSEVMLAERLLNSLVLLLGKPDASMADNLPGQPPGAGGERLQGKLYLTRALVKVPCQGLAPVSDAVLPL
jgi:hypothetical protein